MRAPSKKKQADLRLDADVVARLYEQACSRWGKEEVDRDLTRLWDMRCILGMHRALPFGATRFTCLGELLWIAEDVCGLGKKEVCSE